ncbi:hypothetical protein Y032_0097g3041 [Ancylostoma ceylanicum]|uniref:Uncharacterized protein n=1 Tax=Ancylostoma ceylanicum TaxID=53326 RepID=A0A016TK33_9BILA|nr:hypothetical protein Y032_0097g3041 [Ancylostoma ceylanicum]
MYSSLRLYLRTPFHNLQLFRRTLINPETMHLKRNLSLDRRRLDRVTTETGFLGNISEIIRRWNMSTISITKEEVIYGDQTDRTIHQRMAIGVTPMMETQGTTTGTAPIIEEVVGGASGTNIFTVMVDGQTNATVVIVNQMNMEIALTAILTEKGTAHSVLATKETESPGTGLNIMAVRLITELLFPLYLYLLKTMKGLWCLLKLRIEVAAINTA